MANDKEGYKGHRVGSAKERVHKVFDEKGKDAAIKKAVSLDLQETTARTWCSTWTKGSKTKKAVKPPAKKKAVKKAAAKKPAAKKVKREKIEANGAAA